MQGHKDSPLNETGRQQAEQAAKTISDVDFDVAISSSSQRAVQTAQILLGSRRVEVIPDDGLREINLGSWEGKPKSRIQVEYHDQYHDFWNAPEAYRSPGGESFPDLWDRVTTSILQMFEHHAGKSILVTSHAASIKAIMSYFAGRPLADIWVPPMALNLSHSILQKQGEHVQVCKFCDDPWGEA